MDIHMKMTRLWNAEEVGGREELVWRQCEHGRDDPGRLQQEETGRLRTGLRDRWSAPMKDTQREQPECQGKTRKEWCPRGKGTESCKGGGYAWSDSSDGNWDGIKKGPLVSKTWRLLIGLAAGVPVR